jgi:copper chaperone CopZ
MRTYKSYAAFRLPLIVTALLLAVACTNEQSTENEDVKVGAQVEVTRTEVPSEAGVEKYVARLDIDGMGCAMACGSKISSALAALEGVNHTGIDFIGAGEKNAAIVEFDASKISEQELIETVNALSGGGHYAVKAVQVVHHTAGASAVEGKDEKVSNFNPNPKLKYAFPNIFSVFSRLF